MSKLFKLVHKLIYFLDNLRHFSKRLCRTHVLLFQLIFLIVHIKATF